MTQAPARRLLLACDAGQTPDRGTLALIAELAGKADETRIWLTGGVYAPNGAATADAAAAVNDATGAKGTNGVNAADVPVDRTATWRARLLEAGMPAHAIMRDADQPLHWLGEAHG
jgi:hypothetical protein